MHSALFILNPSIIIFSSTSLFISFIFLHHIITSNHLFLHKFHGTQAFWSVSLTFRNNFHHTSFLHNIFSVTDSLSWALLIFLALKMVSEASMRVEMKRREKRESVREWQIKGKYIEKVKGERGKKQQKYQLQNSLYVYSLISFWVQISQLHNLISTLISHWLFPPLTIYFSPFISNMLSFQKCLPSITITTTTSFFQHFWSRLKQCPAQGSAWCFCGPSGMFGCQVVCVQAGMPWPCF